MNNISQKNVAIGGGLNGRLKLDGTYDPYETQDKYFETMENIYDKRYGCKCRHLKGKDIYNKNLVKDKE